MSLVLVGTSDWLNEHKPPLPPPPAAGVQGHGVPQIVEDEKQGKWVAVKMMKPPADAVPGSPRLEGWLRLSDVICPGLLLSYDYLAYDLLREELQDKDNDVENAYPTNRRALAQCNKLLGERFLSRVSKVAYPLLGINEYTDEMRDRLRDAFAGTPARRGQPDSRGVAGALLTLEEHLRSGTRFACCEKPCIADLSVVPPLLLLNVIGAELSPAIQQYVRRFEDHFGAKYKEIKEPVEQWVERHRARVAELGISLTRSA